MSSSKPSGNSDAVNVLAIGLGLRRTLLSRRLLVALCLALLAGLPTAQAQSQSQSQSQSPPAPAATESAVKAAYLFRFVSFVDWPAGAFKRRDEPVLIAVAGDDEVFADLEPLLAGRVVDGRTLRAVRVTGQTLPEGVHMLFLGADRDLRRDPLAATPGPVLLVTDHPDALRHGGVINFSKDGARVRFSISLAAAETRGLKLSARLLDVAQAVQGAPR